MPINDLGLDIASFVVHESRTRFDVPRQYRVLEPVGRGAFGIVCAAHDADRGERFAVKKIMSTFDNLLFAKQTLRELRILRLMDQENVIDIDSVFFPGAKESFNDIYIVSTLMQSNLATVIRNQEATLTDDHCQFFLYQILRGLKYIHSAKVIHRDLKPRNLLVNSDCDLKICDFGLARVDCGDDGIPLRAGPMTQYVCTRWWRAPEILCSFNRYNKAVDVWSVGCIFAEMMRRKPLFPGLRLEHQLELIITCLGMPDKNFMQRISSEMCRRFVESFASTAAGMPIEQVAPNTSRPALDLLSGMLALNPEARLTAEDALKHPYLSTLHCPEDEPSAAPLNVADFAFEEQELDLARLREELFKEALHYHPQRRQQVLLEEEEEAAAGAAAP